MFNNRFEFKSLQPQYENAHRGVFINSWPVYRFDGSNPKNLSKVWRPRKEANPMPLVETPADTAEGSAENSGREAGGGKATYTGDSLPSEARSESKREAASTYNSDGFTSIDAPNVSRRGEPFLSAIIAGPSMSGKTHLCLSLLRQFVKEKRYDRYVIMSPSGRATGVWDNYLKNKDNIIADYDEGALAALMEEQKSTPKEQRKRVCLIVDDCICHSAKQARSPVFADLFCLARNFSMSVLMLVQAVNRNYCSKLSRVNTHWLFCCGLRSKSCHETLRNDYLTPLKGDNTGLELYSKITEGKYNFCCFHLRNPEAKGLEDWVHRIRAEAKIGPFKMNNDWIAPSTAGKGLPYTSNPVPKMIKEKAFSAVREEQLEVPKEKRKRVRTIAVKKPVYKF